MSFVFRSTLYCFIEEEIMQVSADLVQDRVPWFLIKVVFEVSF